VSTRSDLVDALDRDRSYVSLADITEIELIILKRMRDVTIGDHRSRSHGSGFDFVGLRDWQAGDRFSSIDWAQSTITNFSPLIVREFEQPSTAHARGGRCRAPRSAAPTDGRSPPPSPAVATIGLSATFFRIPSACDLRRRFAHLTHVPPRTGKSHLVHCLDASVRRHVKSGSDQTDGDERRGAIGGAIRRFARTRARSGHLRLSVRDADAVLRDLALVAATHDVFLVLIDSAFAYELPPVSAGWLEIADVETGRSRLVSRRAYARVAERAREWQVHVQQTAKSLDLDVIVIGLDQAKSDIALGEFVAERRLRKTYS
jgi:uncharacterized protein (DUF58 family)